MASLLSLSGERAVRAFERAGWVKDRPNYYLRSLLLKRARKRHHDSESLLSAPDLDDILTTRVPNKLISLRSSAHRCAAIYPIRNQQVAGSIPAGGSSFKKHPRLLATVAESVAALGPPKSPKLLTVFKAYAARTSPPVDQFRSSNAKTDCELSAVNRLGIACPPSKAFWSRLRI